MRQRTIRNTILSVFVCLFAMAGTGNAKTIYVDADAPGANDGSTWADAYNYLQDALADANESEKPVEIRVAQEVYKPDRSSAEPNGTGDREATFQLISGVTLKGGYVGFGSPDPNARDIKLYDTILSGDLNGDDGPNFANNDENCYHVVTGSDTDETAILDGFTVCGGMYNTNTNPTVINCLFRGSAMNNQGSSPTVANCIFSDGQIENYGGAPTIRNCLFTGNSSIQGDTSTITVVNCTFTGNAGTSPAAVWDYSTATFDNCIFWGNGPTRIYHDCPGTTITFTYSNILGGRTAIVNPCDPCSQ